MKITQSTPLKLSYVTTYDAKNIHSWSGTGYYIAQSLIKQGIILSYINNLSTQPGLYTKINKVFHRLFNKDKKFLESREFSVSKNYASQIIDTLSPDTDVIFSPGSIPMAFLKTNKKKVFYTDATFASIINYYDSFSNLGRHTIKSGNQLEKKALENCDLAIYASEWAAKSAIEYYKINPEKIKVVPFGANIESSRNENDIQAIIKSKSKEKCNLLFLGVDWDRKGGKIAVDTALLLEKMGIPVQLDIIGIHDKNLILPSFAKNHGFISKSTEDGKKLIDRFLSNAHFLILPTQAECYGIVFCEAASYGLPCISTKTGGVTTIIKDDINGKTFDLSSTAEEYAEYIVPLFTNQEEYKKLALSSFHEYETRLNWDVAGKKIIELIKEI